MRITVIKENFSVIKDFTILGFMGENNARVIEVNQPEVEGADTYRLRFEYQDGVVYDLPIENGIVTVTGSLLREVGMVNCQWLATKAVDDSYELVAKSQVFSLSVEPSIEDSATPIPSPEIATDALARMQETVAQAENCVADAQVAVAQAETIAQGVEEAVSEVKSTTDQVAQNTATLSEIITKSEIEYETLEGKAINVYGLGLEPKENAFTVFIKIPDDFAYVAVTPTNTANIVKSCYADENKKILGNYGFTDVDRVWTTFSKPLLDNENAKYFVVSYTAGTEFEIEIGRGSEVNTEQFIPVAETELGADFIQKSHNRVRYLTKIDCANPYGWRYSGRLETNLFEVKNGEKLYHNGGAVLYLYFFDADYTYLSTAKCLSGDAVKAGNNVKYASAYVNGGDVPENLWIADKVLSEKEKSTTMVINPLFLPEADNTLANSPLPFNFDFKAGISDENVTLITNYNTESNDTTGYTLPDFDNKLTFGRLCVCDDIAVKSVVTLTSTNCNVLLGSANAYSGERCSMVQFDFANNAINIAPANDGTAIPDTVFQTADMTSAIDSNLTYILEVGRKQRELYAKITNYNTGASVETVVSESDANDLSYPAGYLYDEPTIALVSGDSVKLERIYSQVKQYDIAFMGDSITEGHGVPYTDCWAYKTGEWSGKSFVIMGRSGGQATCLNRQAEEILPYIKPEYVVVTIGTNSGNTVNNLTTLMEKIRKIGASPILNYICTMSNSTSSQNVNNVIASLGEHGARFDIATAKNNDISQGQDTTALFQPDKLHPNVAGHTACFERFKLDCEFVKK